MKEAIFRSLICLQVVFMISCAQKITKPEHTVDFPPKEEIRIEDVLDAIPRPDPIFAQGNFSPYEVRGIKYTVLDDYLNYYEEGMASWYGMKFHGNKTANGEIYDVKLATAAHRSLPLPCYVRVINLENGRSMVVRINDRGPFHPDRIIDLSYASALKLGFVKQGTTKVSVSVIDVEGVDDRRPARVGQYRFLQLGAFQSEFSARRLLKKAEPISKAPIFLSRVKQGLRVLYRVRIGPFSSTSAAAAQKKILELEGFSSMQLLP